MLSFFHFIYKYCINFIWPPFCAHCKLFLEKRVVFCSCCLSKIEPIASYNFFITKKKVIKVFAISSYKDPIRSLILKKHSSDIVASYQLGILMWKLTYIQNIDFDIVSPVPLHWTRFAKRGFNQAEEIAKVIAKKSGKKFVNLIKRVKKTKFQASLDFHQRTNNVKDAFILRNKNNSDYEGKKIVIVDDLMTTGSTIKSVTKLLYLLKPKKIYVVVGARAI